MAIKVLITGATDGIGLALANRYQQQKAHLILVGRRPLAELEGPLFTTETYCQADLCDTNCTAQISAWLHAHNVTELDLVIHNAGIGYVGDLATQPAANIQQLLQVNLWTPIALSHLLYPYVERAQGKIGFVSSVVTALPGPDYAVYTATKTALEGFVRSWQVELTADKSPVRLQILRPGATRTNMHQKSGADLNKLNTARFPSAETVADQLIAALASDQRAVTLGTFNKVVYTVGHHLDDFIEWAMRRTRRTTNSVSEPPAQQPPHCVITGAADGIGRALAHAFAAAGYTITGIDIDATRAATVSTELTAYKGDVQFITADLADTETFGTLSQALANRPPISVLIHNAGISAVGPFMESNLARQRAVYAINLVAPLVITADLLQRNHLVNGATLVFLSSLSRFVGYPGATVYAASKDGLAAYARGVAVAQATHQHVLTVYPGPTRTAHARRYSPDNRRENRRMLPETLAAQILAAVQAKRRKLIPGLANRSVAVLGRILPGPAEQLMRRTIYEKLRVVGKSG